MSLYLLYISRMFVFLSFDANPNPQITDFAFNPVKKTINTFDFQSMENDCLISHSVKNYYFNKSL